MALFVVGLVQMIVFLSPVLIARALLPRPAEPRGLDLPPLVFDPVRMSIGFLILMGGFALFTTTLVAIGAVMPTAKEAGNFMGVMMALIFVPFYAVSLVVSEPHADRADLHLLPVLRPGHRFAAERLRLTGHV